MARFWITGTVTYYQEANPGFGTNTNVGNSNMAADTWYNLSAKVVGTNNTWTVNGTTIGSNVTTAATLTTQTDLTIGLGQYQTIVQYDNVRVRKSTATEPTVGSPTNEEKSQGPIAYWKFDEGQGITTNNSGNGGSTLNGTITNATWQTEDQCINGKCLYFNGSSGYVQVPISTPLKPTTALTISFWMKMTATQAGWQTIIGNSPYSSGYLVFMETGGAYLRYLVNINSTEYRLNSTFTPALNTWYHVTYVVDPANITMTSYINGKYDTSTGIPNGTITHNNNPLSFAQGGANYFKGYMDEPKIYPYARTAAQIKSDYNSQGTVKDSSVQIGSKNPRESFSHG